MPNVSTSSSSSFKNKITKNAIFIVIFSWFSVTFWAENSQFRQYNFQTNAPGELTRVLPFKLVQKTCAKAAQIYTFLFLLFNFNPKIWQMFRLWFSLLISLFAQFFQNYCNCSKFCLYVTTTITFPLLIWIAHVFIPLSLSLPLCLSLSQI